MQDTPPLLFDRSKPFYPFIMSFYASLHGSLDLIARRIVDEVAESDGNTDDARFSKLKTLTLEQYKGAFKTPQLLGEQLILSSLSGADVVTDWSELEAAFYENTDYLVPLFFEAPLRMLIISCYEVSVQHYDPTDEVWRFFKYVKSAAAHGGYFSLVKRNGAMPVSPEKPAKWANKEIQMFMDEDPLLVSEGDKEAFMKPGDILRLLADVEAKF